MVVIIQKMKRKSHLTDISTNGLSMEVWKLNTILTTKSNCSRIQHNYIIKLSSEDKFIESSPYILQVFKKFSEI